jgi:hypothetical protein
MAVLTKIAFSLQNLSHLTIPFGPQDNRAAKKKWNMFASCWEDSKVHQVD